jgi:ABC-2 type transport system ATP-binding protein
VLDEPTSGLDPLMEQAFQDVVRKRREEGCTVLLSSHLLGEVEALADRVTIIRRGRTVTTGTLAELRRHTRTHVHAVTADAPAGLADAPGVADYGSERLDGHVDSRFTVDAEHLDGVVGMLHGARIQTLTVTPPSLDALFLRSYEGGVGPLDAAELGDPVDLHR